MSFKFPNLLRFFRSILEQAAVQSQNEKKNMFPHFRWRLSMTKLDIDQDDKQLEDASKYLIYMERKIARKIANKEYASAWKHFDLMLRKSKVFALFILNKVDKDWWYTRSYKNLQTIMSKFNRHARLKEHMLAIHRTYIPKKTPGKVRPLGAPSIEVRLLMAALTEFINIYAENYVGSYQYGFLPKRASYQLGVEIVRRLAEGKRFYEFDLDSFFNRVDYIRVLKELPFETLSKWIMNINTFSIPVPKEKNKYGTEIDLDEKGWHSTDMEFKNFGTCAYKQGFTQGANYSPVLSVMALEMAGFGKLEGLLMGADDGLLEINSSLESNIEKLKNAGYGIHLAEDKYFGPCADQFKFFGWEFDTLKQTVTSGEETKTYRQILIDEELFKNEGNKKFFGKSPKYSGKVNYKCGMIHTNKNLNQGIDVKPGIPKFFPVLENVWNWTVHEESMLTLAPTCNFTLPSAKRIFMKSQECKIGEHGDIYTRTWDPQYYDLNTVGNWCNVRMLELLSKLSTWKCAHVKERYYEGNPLVETPGLSFMTPEGIAVHVRSFPKGTKTYDESLDWGFLTESNHTNIRKKVYWDYILEDLKTTSLMYKNQIKHVLLTRGDKAVTAYTYQLPETVNNRWTYLTLENDQKFVIHPEPLMRATNTSPLTEEERAELEAMEKELYGSKWREKVGEKTVRKSDFTKVETLEDFLKEKP